MNPLSLIIFYCARKGEQIPSIVALRNLALLSILFVALGSAAAYTLQARQGSKPETQLQETTK